MTLNLQVAGILERVARSPLPPYHTVPAHIARRIYRDTRSVLAPKAPEVAEVRLQIFGNRVAVRSYRPVAEAFLPALVFFHGGGWTIGDLDTHDGVCRQLSLGARCAVFSVDYRLAPEHPFPAAVDDCFFAAKYLSERATEFEVDPTRIAVGGDSAGGNLAAVVALMARDQAGPPLAYQLLIYPATDQRCELPSHARNGEGYLLTKEAIRFFRAGYLPDPKDRTDWRASPLLASSHAGLPPAYVVSYREYSDMVHGFVLFGGVVDAANAAVEECCEQLRRALEKITV